MGSVVLSHLGEMLYPLLNLGTSFPPFSHSETVDSLLRNGSIRVRRARSEVEPSILTYRRDTSGARQWTPSYRLDREMQHNPDTTLWGKSSSFTGRSKYFPTTPKYRTEYPRFHTGFCFVPMFHRK